MPEYKCSSSTYFSFSISNISGASCRETKFVKINLYRLITQHMLNSGISNKLDLAVRLGNSVIIYVNSQVQQRAQKKGQF